MIITHFTAFSRSLDRSGPCRGADHHKRSATRRASRRKRPPVGRLCPADASRCLPDACASRGATLLPAGQMRLHEMGDYHRDLVSDRKIRPSPCHRGRYKSADAPRQNSYFRPNCGQVRPELFARFLITETSPLCPRWPAGLIDLPPTAGTYGRLPVPTPATALTSQGTWHLSPRAGRERPRVCHGAAICYIGPVPAARDRPLRHLLRHTQAATA